MSQNPHFLHEMINIQTQYDLEVELLEIATEQQTFSNMFVEITGIDIETLEENYSTYVLESSKVEEPQKQYEQEDKCIIYEKYHGEQYENWIFQGLQGLTTIKEAESIMNQNIFNYQRIRSNNFALSKMKSN